MIFDEIAPFEYPSPLSELIKNLTDAENKSVQK
jgi:hypothetical protein